jgi:hypothetical protein
LKVQKLWLGKAPVLLLGAPEGHRFHRWGAFSNRFLKALI